MPLDQRLDRLMGALTAKERGILVLRSLKNKTTEDPNWRLKMPRSQAPEFNRYIDLMNSVNMRLGYLVMVLMKETEMLEMKQSWLFTVRLWELNLAELDLAASVVAREPISESDHKRLAEQTAGQYVAVKTLARVLAEKQRRWTDEDLDEYGWSSELVVKDEVMERLCTEAEAEIRRAVAEGKLDHRGKAKRLLVCSGSFDAWLGRPPATYPKWAAGYDVRPDEEAATIQVDLQTLAHLQDALSKTPLDRLLEGRIIDEQKTVTGFAELLERGLREGALSHWHAFRAVEVVVEQVAAEFDGEDPLKPVYRDDINASKAMLKGVADYLEHYGQPVEFTEPEDDEIQGTRELLEMGSRLLP